MICGQVAKSGLKVAKCQTLVLVDIKVGFENNFLAKKSTFKLMIVWLDQLVTLLYILQRTKVLLRDLGWHVRPSKKPACINILRFL